VVTKLAKNTQAAALPEEFEMDIHCIRLNDYLNIQGIKLKSDVPPSYLYPPSHETTARSRPALRYHLSTIQVIY
jgi:hypothetical protein